MKTDFFKFWLHCGLVTILYVATILFYGAVFSNLWNWFSPFVAIDLVGACGLIFILRLFKEPKKNNQHSNKEALKAFADDITHAAIILGFGYALITISKYF